MRLARFTGMIRVHLTQRLTRRRARCAGTGAVMGHRAAGQRYVMRPAILTRNRLLDQHSSDSPKESM